MNQPAAPESRERWTYLGLSVFVAVLWFATLSLRPLFNPDEGRYAEIASRDARAAETGSSRI